MDLVQYESWVISELKSVQATPGCAMPELDLRANLSENFGVSADRSYRILKRIIQHNSRVSLEKWTAHEYAVIYR